MTAWTCPECASHNPDAGVECAVCGAERPVSIRPVSSPEATETTCAPATAVTEHSTGGDWHAPTEPPGRHAGTWPAAGTYGTDVGADQTRESPGPAAPGYRRRRPPPNRWALWAPLGALALVLAAIAGVTVVPGLLRAEPQARVDPTGTPVATPPSTPLPTEATVTEESTPSPTPSTSTDLVTVDPIAATDPRAQPVATVLYQYFSAINNRDYATALSVYDPAGVVNPNDPAQVDAFNRALSTTYDSQVRILGIATDTSGEGAVLANVTFHSNQDQGYGPKSNPGETCTVWALTFTLTQRDFGSYQILASTGNHSACP